MKPERPVISFNEDILKARGFEPSAEGIGIDRDQSVMNVKEAHAQALPAVHAGEHAAGPQDSPDLPEQLVLQIRGGQVVEHGERDRSGEPGVHERHRRGIAPDDRHVTAAEPSRQRIRQHRIDFERGNAGDALPQQVGREPGAWSDLQNFLPEFHTAQDPRHDFLFQRLSPKSRAAHPPVNAIHLSRALLVGHQREVSIILPVDRVTFFRYCDK